jgi:hypothetical protein
MNNVSMVTFAINAAHMGEIKVYRVGRTHGKKYVLKSELRLAIKAKERIILKCT